MGKFLIAERRNSQTNITDILNIKCMLHMYLVPRVAKVKEENKTEGNIHGHVDCILCGLHS